uniref:ATP synthase F0 subunit 8 n=1 Tax=Parathailocyba orla TaxID=2745910 RepID=A0A7D5BA59_9HEMI|nr:ATP synthase F0 subunit 8 [Parathailocyba orla]
MPQMSNMWWTMLMMTFIITFMMAMFMVYFNYMKLLTKNTDKKTKNMNWLW